MSDHFPKGSTRALTKTHTLPNFFCPQLTRVESWTSSISSHAAPSVSSDNVDLFLDIVRSSRCGCVVNLKSGCEYAVRYGLWRSQRFCSNREIEGENCLSGDGSGKGPNCPTACAGCNCASSPRTPGCVRCPSSGNRGSCVRIFVKCDHMAREDDCFTETQRKKKSYLVP